VIQQYVEDGITDLVLDEEDIEQIQVDVKEDMITVEKM
jgi:ATP-dependent Clp protease ATP-binding subunit ClpE